MRKRKIKINLIVVLCISFFISACSLGWKKNKDPKNQLWKILDVDFPDGNSGNEDLNHDNCFISLNTDETYNFFINGYYSWGKWVKSGNDYKLLRSADEKEVAVFNIKGERRNEATILVTVFDDQKIQKTSNSDEVAQSVELPVELMKKGFRIDAERERRGTKADPYALRYNRWRQKPDRRETDKEIRERVRNHVEFMQMYFENALEIGLGVVSEPNLASPFECYSNGISVRKFDEISDWQDLFFDTDDARKGYEIVNNEMKKKFALIKTRNAFELNADIFRKLLKLID